MKYKQRDGFLLKDLAGDKILVARGTLALDFTATIVFNKSGLFMWQNLATPKSVNELADLIMNEFNIESDIATSDVLLFIEKGVQEGILEKVD